MRLSITVCLVVLAYFLSYIIVPNKCNKLDGYRFPVYSTSFCPRNESEWNRRSSALNCNKTNGYMCLPNENFTKLLEFCYKHPWIWVQEGVCLVLKREGSFLKAYNCSRFTDGCHNTSYQSRKIFECEHCGPWDSCYWYFTDPACISIGNGCFLAEPSCKSFPNTTVRPETSEIGKAEWTFTVILIGIVVVFILSSCLLYYWKNRKCPSRKRSTDIERPLSEFEEERSLIKNIDDKKDSSNESQGESEGKKSLITNTDTERGDSSYEELPMERGLFDKWKEIDSCFISTSASKEVEKIIERNNMVIVGGHSGSGKSAIIQHIALKYKEHGWTVKRVKKVEEIVTVYSSSRFQKNKTICVCNDPVGKEFFDEILNSSWEKYEEELTVYLQSAKLMMSCRNHIIADTRLTSYFLDQSHIVNIDGDKLKLSDEEKRLILTRYTFDMNLSAEEWKKIFEVEKYFPLLCKLFSHSENSKTKVISFFTEPVSVLKNELIKFKIKDKGKYCALATLVLFNDDLCVRDLLKNKDTEIKFKHTLKLCGLPEYTPPSAISDNLNCLKGFLVKEIGGIYHFYHDFVMEVTTHVLGTDYPAEIVKYADIGFLRKRVKLGDCEELDDSFTIFLSDRYIEELGERLYTELFGERFLDVILNPCLRNEKVIKVLEKKIADHPKNLEMFHERKKYSIDKQSFDHTSKKVLLTKLSFLDLENQVSPLFALISFCHSQLSQYCLNILQKTQIDFNSYISAVCCNGSKELFNSVLKDKTNELKSNTWGGLFPIHIVSVFHNYQLLNEMIQLGIDLNQRSEQGGWTPLILAAGNDTQEYGDYCHEESSATRRDKTVQLLLGEKANVNFRNNKGVSPLYIACQNRHDSTVELLVNNGANPNAFTKKGINPIYLAIEKRQSNNLRLFLRKNGNVNFLCSVSGASPLHIACQCGQDENVELLLDHGADINICVEDEVSPLYIAFAWRQYETVNILLKRGADTSLRSGLNPTYLDLFDENDITIKYLLQKDNIYKNIYDPDSYFSLFVFCHVEKMSRALFKEDL